MNINNNRKPYFKLGFTLAEILITLIIVGVVATMTIPNLMNKYQKHQTIVKLKKTIHYYHRLLN